MTTLIREFRSDSGDLNPIPEEARRYAEAHEMTSLLAGDLSEENQEIINREWQVNNQIIDFMKPDESLESFILRRYGEINKEEEIKAKGLTVGSLMEEPKR